MFMCFEMTVNTIIEMCRIVVSPNDRILSGLTFTEPDIWPNYSVCSLKILNVEMWFKNIVFEV